ncbi:hypothetical protein FQN57_002500 [Myotisia sp. PD_48]|nr:hypothetical protein FQN57_002500 [Myotisia sp. PD_48]
MALLAVLWFLVFLPVLGSPHEGRKLQNVLSLVGVGELPVIKPIDTCWDKLICTVYEIERMAIPSRLEFMKYMSANKFGELSSSDQFRAIEGIMDFFIRKQLAGQGTALSLMDAAVVEGIQRGAAIALGLSQVGGDNPASAKWAIFFEQQKTGGLTDRYKHDLMWASAEQTALDYGIRLTQTSPGFSPPSSKELRWMQFTNVYRVIMRYRRTISWLFKAAFTFTDPAVSMTADAFMDWLTDITDSTAVGFLADIAWTLSALGLSKDGEDPIADSEFLLRTATEFWEAFQMSPTNTSSIVSKH